jgi:hypothetical protein
MISPTPESVAAASLREPVLLLYAYALLHGVSYAFIPWGMSWPALAFAAFLLGKDILVPLFIAAGIRARAQWAWYLAMLLGSWISLRNIVAMVGAALQSDPRAASERVLSLLPIAGIALLCLLLVRVLMRSSVRSALHVRAG